MAIGIRGVGSFAAGDRLYGSAADTMVATAGKPALLMNDAQPLLVGEAALF